MEEIELKIKTLQEDYKVAMDKGDFTEAMKIRQ